MIPESLCTGLPVIPFRPCVHKPPKQIDAFGIAYLEQFDFATRVV